MRNIKSLKKFFLFSSASMGLFLALPAQAVCPVCVVAVGAGLGFSRWLGIDDTISGLWIGGLVVSLIMWTNNWLVKKNFRFKADKVLIASAFFLLVVVPLYWTGIIGHPYNTLWEIDKLILGIVLGSLGFWLGDSAYFYFKKQNNGKVYFPFQKVVMPVVPLIILSIVFYFLIK
ncbi:hypothetical protein COY65_01085 [Candidatus Jorgensenbacteria bacterium CG_4_10_14_0_8_um_filter_39_13]|uniref:DUF2085 domain-containing protein n=2 Tax=Candidatus Joergenseniibacteriota TaxID=1752739 RepID=A0A2M7RI78_9BACT|nr:MAG: hypothetical protein COV54_01750 [Candidatus Jorgensenbacteria bacterium CG11_big_fil_rev_8_21_14_0_20_38_23]PIV12913.1 MAG: hypothetical protein COS46_03050 [Candidatus Jorgensenbacteria bacterium CG03_land_8_20_14_0_80_38_39]PIW97648.1 MAG: hypothetical protein COZ81_01600 [Candidatus Jorgensenbacteria bacterium CG_4_8_14_3_um_filter_38_10]PIY96262.1 MAG: hypothetical protein COY65_01085 [Candidatus Jorgensenbacteria bacterium CG_4_10_14_0_8_um_filter_39_13]PJA95193.1 MAG: hypothetica